MPRKLTDKEYKDKLRILPHFGNLNYEEFTYINSKQILNITCKLHNYRFSQDAFSHAKGALGCRFCNPKTKITKEDFFSNLKGLANRDNYEFISEYRGQGKVITAKCRIHGLEITKLPKSWVANLHCCPSCIEKSGRVTESYFLLACRDLANYENRDYSETQFITSESPITVKCTLHNLTYTQSKARYHLLGKEGCPECKLINNRLGYAEWKVKAEKKHGLNFSYLMDYPYTTKESKVVVTCKKHGEVTTTYSNHLRQKHGGCKKCFLAYNRIATLGNKEEFVEKSLKVHNGKYSYNNGQYISRSDYFTITCPIHGDFQQRASDHIDGAGCKKCASEEVANLKKITTEKLTERGESKFPHIDYKDSKCQESKDFTQFTCKTHKLTYIQQVSEHLSSRYGGCRSCASAGISKLEDALYELLLRISPNLEIIRNTRNIITSSSGNPLEVDLYLPQFSLGIEVNGCYWHSEAAPISWSSTRMRHKYKTEACAEKGIDLIHIYEDEFSNLKKLESYFTSKLGVLDRVFARKCKVSYSEPKPHVSKFLEDNHLLGTCKYSKSITLLLEGKLAAVMTFSKNLSSRTLAEDGVWELSRYCSNGIVVGGFSKLLKNFIKSENPSRIVSYSDSDKFTGEVYEKYGFILDSISPPDYKYVERGVRKHKSGYRRKRLEARFGNFDPLLSEKDNCFNNGLYRIWDCGKKRWVLEL